MPRWLEKSEEESFVLGDLLDEPLCVLRAWGVKDEEAKSELRKLIRQHLSEELRKLRDSVDEQIKASEQAISKRLQSASAEHSTTASPSGKGKKK